MSRPQPGQLERSLAAITIGLHQGQKFRARTLADSRTGEYEQQVQLSVSGDAGNEWSYSDNKVYFEFPFLFAPAQRLVPFDRPHFTKGFELENPSGTLIHLDAQVIDWLRDDSNWTIGATVRVYVVAPMATVAAVPYTAIGHFRFQGFASYPEGNEYHE